MPSSSPGCGKCCEDADKPATERHFRNNQEGLRTDWLFDHVRRLSLTAYSVMMTTRLHWTGRVLTGERTELGLSVEQQVGGVGLGEPAMQVTWRLALRLCLCARPNMPIATFALCRPAVSAVTGPRAKPGCATWSGARTGRGGLRAVPSPVAAQGASTRAWGTWNWFRSFKKGVCHSRHPDSCQALCVCSLCSSKNAERGVLTQTLHGRRLGLSRVGADWAVD